MPGTEEAGLALDQDFHGCAWGDYDEDGDLDLYQTVGAEGGMGLKSNFLYRNDGPTFTDVAEAAGVTDPPGRGRSAAWLDYDNDGNLDLFVGNAARADGPNALFRNLGNGVFANTAVPGGGGHDQEHGRGHPDRLRPRWKRRRFPGRRR